MADRRFHFATISNRPQTYAEMRESMAAVGFTEQTCRFTLLDNATANAHDPYQVLRDLPTDGDEPYYVLCHQDLLFDERTSYDRLSQVVAELDRRDDRWAVAGTAGISPHAERLLHLDDPTGRYRVDGLPRRVITLDENFLLVRRSNAVVTSPGLVGFHFYGADLCLGAIAAGRTNYVIDFPVRHLSSGVDSPAFYEARAALAGSWKPRLLVGVINTTCTQVCVSCNPLLHRLIQFGKVIRLIEICGMMTVPRLFQRASAAARPGTALSN